MTGRSLHDALLRVLTSATLRARLAGGDEAGLASLVGSAEAAVLVRADAGRVTRLARFLGRHFYRERIVRLFAASRRLARADGWDPLAALDTPEFDALLERAEVGSPETAEAVARLIERPLATRLASPAWGPELVRYEGALFRAEACSRRWRGADPASGVPARSTSTRIVELGWDVTGLVAAARRGDAGLPEPPPGPTRLLVALAPDGRVTAARCPEPLARLLGALDGHRSPAEVARQAGLDEPEAIGVLRQLTEIGAVEWRERAAERASPPESG